MQANDAAGEQGGKLREALGGGQVIGVDRIGVFQWAKPAIDSGTQRWIAALFQRKFR